MNIDERLTVKINNFSSYGSGISYIDTLTRSKIPLIISFINTQGYNLANNSNDFFKSLNISDVLLRDGTGALIACKKFSKEPGVNFCGTDFIPILTKHFAKKNKRFAVFGSSKRVVKKFYDLYKFDLNISLYSDGFMSIDKYVNLIELNQDIDIVILGMGMPKQEILSRVLKRKIKRKLLIINGGAVIDYMSNSVMRAPKIMRFLGIEWLFRLIIEPRRLYRRYIFGNPKFIYRLLKAKQ